MDQFVTESVAYAMRAELEYYAKPVASTIRFIDSKPDELTELLPLLVAAAGIDCKGAVVVNRTIGTFAFGTTIYSLCELPEVINELFAVHSRRVRNHKNGPYAKHRDYRFEMPRVVV